MRTVLAYLTLAALIASVLAYIGPARDIWALKSRGSTVSGNVARLTCGDHGTVRYQYVVAGRSYAGRGHYREKPCPDTRVGEEVTVYYLPDLPSTSTLEEPRSEWKNEAISIAAAALLIPAFGIWSYKRRKRNAA